MTSSALHARHNSRSDGLRSVRNFAVDYHPRPSLANTAHSRVKTNPALAAAATQDMRQMALNRKPS